MADGIEAEMLEDGTLAFVPERLNRDPVVLRGLTDGEMKMALCLGAGVGLVLGVPLGVVSASVAMVPTSIFGVAAVFLLGGGSVLRRMKRGRPDTWFYRHLQWRLAIQLGLYRQELILHAGAWTVRRSRRHRPVGGRA